VAPAQRVSASTLATVTTSDQSLGGGVWQYSMTLNNTGTTNIATLWYAWIPGQDYMSVSPTNIVNPANWTDVITGGGGSDGFAIQFDAASGHALAAGNSLAGFSFDSTMTPAQMNGKSIFYNTTPVTTSFVYSNGPLSGTSDEFNFTFPVPEPSSIALAGCGAAGLVMAGRRRKLTRDM
jgi:hypothetical protein